MSDSNKTEITDSFDGLRGVLAVWVLLSHVTQYIDGPAGIIKKGGIAVDLFMFVSGFLMVWTVMSREVKEPTNSLKTWRRFFVRRLFRIAPLYFLALLVAYLFGGFYHRLLVDIYAAIGQGFDRPFRECRATLPIDILLHITFLYGLIPCSAASNVLPDWSLSLEMQFYALFPLLFLALTRSRGILLALISVLVAGVFQHSVGIYSIDPSKLISFPQPSILPLRINCFVAGMTMAMLVWKQSRDLWLLAATVIAITLFQRLTFIAIALCFLLMIVARANMWLTWNSRYLAPLRAAEAILTSRGLRFLGDISFGVYLVHLLVLLPIVSLLNQFVWFLAFDGAFKFVLVSFAALPPVILLSWLLHRCVERPMISLGRRVTSRS